MGIDNQDMQWMERALRLGEKGRLISPPNPWVGCVILQGQRLVGEGFTQAPGKAHAEIIALEQAGAQAKESTVYVTLEPCVHFGRTAPCVNALIRAEVKRVCIGLEDPDPRVAGQGIKALRNAGIEVVVGLLENEISQQLAPYLHHRKTGLPFCILKSAVSIDGRTAAEDGESQWITTSEARQDAHLLRSQSQAILIGAGTALKDQPSLTVREVKAFPLHPPLRVVLDSTGRVPPQGPLFDTRSAPTFIFTTTETPLAVKAAWEEKGVRVETVPSPHGTRKVDLTSVLKKLGEQGVLQLLVEGGASVHEAFWREGFAHHILVYVGPRLLGSTGLPLFNDLSFCRLEEAPVLELLEVRRLGQSVKMVYKGT